LTGFDTACELLGQEEYCTEWAPPGARGEYRLRNVERQEETMSHIKAIATLGVLLMATTASATATICTINNTSSSPKTIEVRSGSSQSCEANVFTGNYTIPGNGKVTVPYGGNVTKVCARTQGGDWYTAHCPGDNSLCFINM
jgi:hypothetical protein